MAMEEIFCFNPDVLNEVALRHRATFRDAKPFPHVSIDNFLPQSTAERILTEFPGPNDIQWKQKHHEHSKKLASHNITQFSPFIRHMLGEFNSSIFLHFLETLTGIPLLISDPYFEGGGLHQIESGGYLDVHADFNKHHALGLNRRINMLLYLNKDWPESYGGHLELWDRNMQTCVQRILPIFNRCVIFSTSDTSYHGHPVPLSAPPGKTRKSIALYYYTLGDSVGGSEAHSTLYQGHPRSRVKSILKKLTPPIAYDVVRIVRSRKKQA